MVTNGHNMTEIDNAAYRLMLMDEANTLVLVSRLYLHSYSCPEPFIKYCRCPLVTSDDLAEVTDKVWSGAIANHLKR